MKRVPTENAQHERARIADACEEIVLSLDRIKSILDARLPKPPSVFPYHIVITESRKAKETQMPIPSGNHFFDQVKVQIVLTPNGILDAPPSWVVDAPECSLEVSPDGLSGTVGAASDVPVWNVTITAPTDNPSTPELEEVSAVVSGSFSHSKATDLGVSVTEIPL